MAAIVSVRDLAVLQAIEDRHDVTAARAATADADGALPRETVKTELRL